MSASTIEPIFQYLTQPSTPAETTKPELISKLMYVTYNPTQLQSNIMNLNNYFAVMAISGFPTHNSQLDKITLPQKERTRFS